MVVANWKMHMGRAQARRWLDVVSKRDRSRPCDVVLCPPALWIVPLSDLCPAGNVSLGGQDCHHDREGAYTGDIAASMLKEAGCRFVILGHSERRRDHGEDDAIVAQKINRALAADLHPIVCVGESAKERANGQTEEVLARQLALLKQYAKEKPLFTVAYEPLWAIGSGRPASAADVAAAHGFIRDTLRGRENDSSKAVRVLYGGSVSPSSDLLHHTDVDGVLVGGASLQADDFLAIITVMSSRSSSTLHV